MNALTPTAALTAATEQHADAPEISHDLLAFPTGQKLSEQEISARAPFEQRATELGFKGQLREQYIQQAMQQAANQQAPKDESAPYAASLDHQPKEVLSIPPSAKAQNDEMQQRPENSIFASHKNVEGLFQPIPGADYSPYKLKR